MLASSESAHPSGDDYGGSMASPVSWVLAAAARRELGGVDAASLDCGHRRGDLVGRVTRTGHQTTSAELNADGSRAAVTTSSVNLRTGAVTTRVSVFDTTTGRQVGSVTSLAGERWTAPVLFGADG
ncbi:MAG TPA: hypothetical protein VEX40_03275, partial [Mycobacterium sp.]|nr:hypothetical protein [Mycobacterium sp.]